MERRVEGTLRPAVLAEELWGRAEGFCEALARAESESLLALSFQTRRQEKAAPGFSIRSKRRRFVLNYGANEVDTAAVRQNVQPAND